MPHLPKGNRPTRAVTARATYINKKRNAFKGMDKSNQYIYNSKRWRRLRLLVLHDQPICVMCEQKNKYTSSSVIDHILPINQGGAVFALNNLQALCSSCHNSKSARDRGRGDK